MATTMGAALKSLPLGSVGIGNRTTFMFRIEFSANPGNTGKSELFSVPVSDTPLSIYSLESKPIGDVLASAGG
jgi:hypothetical protein